ncbi:hypothetical protein [Brevibacterium gallinarum]|uniref:Uncharacterized protein n=1 Tax=Brevibacterium gallinarum TaxID=2762220 RepID=A0ABR8WQP3_9MICO|nr:hypothetical protein [Brevibacterium gallinarum]MBD8019397.1 hypothetical protein [Brevibacterium gallinarum]
MADPTAYDLVQDARLDAHEALITPQPRQRPAAQYSFPIVGQDISDDEFMQMMIATPSGIADEGGQPFWLRQLDDATRTAQLTVSKTTGDGKAAIAGFFYRLLQDVTISLPMPATSTRYHVCLTYDPLGHSRPEGPISVQTYAGEPPTSGGRRHIVLWIVPCEPSQLLSDVKLVQVRPKAAPQLTVDTAEQLPSPQSVLWGTTCIITYGHEAGAIYQADGDDPDGRPQRWDNITNPPWKNIGLRSEYTSSGGNTPQYRVKDGYVELRGSIERKDKGDLTRNTTKQFGWIPGLDMSPFRAFPVATTGGRPCRVDTMDGTPTYNDLGYYTESTIKWFCLDGIRFPVKGYVS